MEEEEDRAQESVMKQEPPSTSHWPKRVEGPKEKVRLDGAACPGSIADGGPRTTRWGYQVMQFSLLQC